MSFWSDLQSFVMRFLLAALAGVIAGALDLWIFAMSWRGFFAGMAAGMVFYVIVLFLFEPGMVRYPLFLTGFAVVSGSLGGLAWWLVCRGSRLWVAMLVGSVMALGQFIGAGLLMRRR